ncbi:MAG: hypothetical protein ACRC5T_08125, partial [Cetobacterium sp.]
MKIINCTVHNLTASQIKDGAFEPSDYVKGALKDILIVNTIPSLEELELRAKKMVTLLFSYAESTHNNIR